MSQSVNEVYARIGTCAIPKILGLLDRNRLSPTYGCFDKAFWHYRTACFPSGMAQELVLPLALVYRYAFAGGAAFYRQPVLKEWVCAGVRYANSSAHRDGSCDDYFPYERALGAVAFSLYACTESALLLELQAPEFESFFIRRGYWLLDYDEAGRLANHHALAVLALYNVYLYTGHESFKQGAQKRLSRLLSWQSAEGWFPEYEGCDPGYHTATIDFLAKYYDKSKDAQVLDPLRNAVHFAVDFMHPDGSFAGVYGSRNTSLFFPHGLELLGALLPEATWLADRYVEGAQSGNRVYLEDDRLIGHLTYNHLQAALDARPRCAHPASPPDGVRLWQDAGLYVRRQGPYHAVLSVAKGGVLKLFEHDRLLYADSGLIARLQNGRCLTSHLPDRYTYQIEADVVRVSGYLGYTRQQTFTPLKMLAFYLIMIGPGRHWSNQIRALLQKILIVGKKRAAIRFSRTVRFTPPITLTDELWDERPRQQGNHRVADLYAGTDHTSIYVAMSNAYQAAGLLPWRDYADYLNDFCDTGYLKTTRVLMKD